MIRGDARYPFGDTRQRAESILLRWRTTFKRDVSKLKKGRLREDFILQSWA